MLQTALPLLAGILSITTPAPYVPVTMSGSPQSMQRQHMIAVESGYDFLRTPREVREALEAGDLVRLSGGEHYAVKHPSDAVTRPEVVHFLERFSVEYRARCRDRLVVTSLTRPLSRQPRNAHPLSVHPAGIAVDLRVPPVRCRKWFESALLEMEAQGILDVTRERRPAHYHLALFPGPYLAHVGMREPAVPEKLPSPPPTAAAPVTLQTTLNQQD